MLESSLTVTVTACRKCHEHRGAGGSGDKVFPFPSPCVSVI